MTLKRDKARRASAGASTDVLEAPDSASAPVLETPAASAETPTASTAMAADKKPNGEAPAEQERGATGIASSSLPIFLRYDPVYREGSDLILWYRVDPGAVTSSGLRALRLRARWHGDDGRVLVWEAEAGILNLDDPGHWQPLRLALPLWPRDCNWLRFELLCGGGARRDRIVTGFMFRSPKQALEAGGGHGQESQDVLASGSAELERFGNRPPDSIPASLSRGASLHVEAFAATPSGALSLLGWIDDTSEPCEALVVESFGFRAEFARDRFHRYERGDVARHLKTPLVARKYGLWLFDSARGPRRCDEVCSITARSGQATLGRAYLRPALATDIEMRDEVLGLLVSRQPAGNSDLFVARSLEAGLGAEIVELNRRIIRDNQAVAVSRFSVPRPIKKSFITCLYGSPEFLPLQVALFSQSERFEEIEFVYINNSPEHAEELQREAKQASRLYDVSITLIQAGANLGFAAANNLAARHAGSDRLLFVNPDVLPKESDWLVKHDAFAAKEEGRIFGACLYYDDGSVMHAGMQLERDSFVDRDMTTLELLRVDHCAKGFPEWVAEARQTRVVPAVTGALMSMARAHFERLGGFDEDYVLGHYEDADLCLRSAVLGAPVWYCAEVKLWHMEGKGSKSRPASRGAAALNRWQFTRRWSSSAPAAGELAAELAPESVERVR
jgi:GT2 family glycosyltransferase